MVCLDEDGAVVRDALLWNDVRSAGAAADLIRELGDGDEAAGRQAWADAVGVVPVASFTATKLRWLADAEPAQRRPDGRRLPPARLADLAALGRPRPGHAGDRPRRRQRHRLLVGAHRRVPARPAGARDARPAAGRAPGRRAGRGRGHPAPAGRPCSGPGTGDNAAAALGLAARPGDVIVSIGTSGVVSAVTPTAVADPSGTVAGFADASGHHLPLVATLNAARVLDAAAALLGVDHAPALRPRPVGAVRVRAAWSWSPTSRASGRRTCRGPPARCTA